MEYAIIILTFQGRNKYLKASLNWLKEKFSGREIIVFTDFNAPKLNGIRFIEGKSNNWCINLANCIQQSKIANQYKNVFILIEDLIPTCKVDFDIIDKSVEYMVQHEIQCIMFPTFKCDWGEIYDTIFKNGQSCKLYQVPAYFKYYSQLQPGLWNLNYFSKVLDVNIKADGDPWSFETTNLGQRHLVSEYCWPNMIGGYVESGRVNKIFLKSNILNSYLPLKLRVLLLIEFIKQKIHRTWETI